MTLKLFALLPIYVSFRLNSKIKHTQIVQKMVDTIRRGAIQKIHGVIVNLVREYWNDNMYS